MDCRVFKKSHQAFLDDTLPGIETAAMREHLGTCAGCSRQDAAIRRSLLLLRNVPVLHPSDDFAERLRERLRTERPTAMNPEQIFRGPSPIAFVSLASALVGVGLFSIAVAGSPREHEAYPRLPAVVVAPSVTAPALVASDVAAPAYVASMSTGMPMWPALLLAEEGSLRFATADLKPASYSPQQ